MRYYTTMSTTTTTTPAGWTPEEWADYCEAMSKPLTQAERYELWPESAYGGDGPWNNYGE